MGQLRPDGCKVRSHGAALAAESHAALRQHEHLVEAGEYQRGGLVDGADHRGFALLRDVIEQRDDGGGGGGVQAGGWFVEDDHARALDERDGEGEAPALAAGEPLEEEATGSGVLARGEAGDGEKLVHLSLEPVGVELGSEILKRKLEVLPRVHGGPQVILAWHVDGLLDEHASAHLVTVQRDVSRGGAGALAVGEGIE